ncbi:hypothetical protein BGW38_008022 [Lunasporangiospora selenospora]|uniref:Uncharacterized protein n=1 Tax=Lunasporangiospora selenospora TaxID=979761 RepID=A0A9P6KI02_9FUNG|nr:hypothetical protein BGW38_008022 [Lunasporangiospora selenospora]
MTYRVRPLFGPILLLTLATVLAAAQGQQGRIEDLDTFSSSRSFVPANARQDDSAELGEEPYLQLYRMQTSKDLHAEDSRKLSKGSFEDWLDSTLESSDQDEGLGDGYDGGFEDYIGDDNKKDDNFDDAAAQDEGNIEAGSSEKGDSELGKTSENNLNDIKQDDNKEDEDKSNDDNRDHDEDEENNSDDDNDGEDDDEDDDDDDDEGDDDSGDDETDFKDAVIYMNINPLIVPVKDSQCPANIQPDQTGQNFHKHTDVDQTLKDIERCPLYCLKAFTHVGQVVVVSELLGCVGCITFVVSGFYALGVDCAGIFTPYPTPPKTTTSTVPNPTGVKKASVSVARPQTALKHPADQALPPLNFGTMMQSLGHVDWNQVQDWFDVAGELASTNIEKSANTDATTDVKKENKGVADGQEKPIISKPLFNDLIVKAASLANWTLTPEILDATGVYDRVHEMEHL